MTLRLKWQRGQAKGATHDNKGIIFSFMRHSLFREAFVGLIQRGRQKESGKQSMTGKLEVCLLGKGRAGLLVLPPCGMNQRVSN